MSAAKTLPTSVSSSRISTPLVDTKRVNTDDLVINSQDIIGVSHDYTDNSSKRLSSAYAVYSAKHSVNTDIQNFKSRLDNLSITPIISDEIVPSYFAEDSAWQIVSGWRYLSGQAYYRNDSVAVENNQATLRLSQNVFYAPGTYFIRIEVSQLDSGSLSIKDYTGTEILPIMDESGIYHTDIDIQYPEVYYLELTAHRVDSGGVITIPRIYIYRVEDRVQFYFNYLAELFVAGDESGLASMDWVTRQIVTSTSEAMATTTSSIQHLDEMVSQHFTATNPHHVTAEQIGLGELPNAISDDITDNDTHTLATTALTHAIQSNLDTHAGDTSNPHQVTKAQIGLGNIPNAISSSTSDNSEDILATTALTHELAEIITQHTQESENPHNVTKEQLGLGDIPNGVSDNINTDSSDFLATTKLTHTLYTTLNSSKSNVGHTHTPEECGAAPTVHTHSFSDLTDMAPVTAHIEDTDNPHNVTKTQVGLGNVENYGVATDEDYLEGSAEKYVTTDGLEAHLQRVFTDDPTLKYSQYAPKKILSQEIELPLDGTFTLPLHKNSRYDIYIDISQSTGAGSVGMHFSDLYLVNGKYNNQWNYGYIEDSVNKLTWRSSVGASKMYLLPKDLGNNLVKGHMSVDTSMYTVSGELQSWVGSYDGSTVSLVSTTVFPIKFTSSLTPHAEMWNSADITFTYIKNRNSTAERFPLKMTLVVYELVSVGTRANVIDPIPILSRMQYLGADVPYGWMIEDGGTIDRALFPKLVAHIQKQHVAVTSAVYDQYIAEYGYCSYFVLEEDTITLPNMPSDIPGVVNIIKTHLEPLSGEVESMEDEETILTGVFDFTDVYNEALGDPSSVDPTAYDLVGEYDAALGDALNRITTNH